MNSDLLSGVALKNVDATGRGQADHMCEADLRPLDLTGPCFTAQVVTDLPYICDSSCCDGVPLGLEAAGYIYRRRASAPRRARLEEVDRVALFAQH